MKNYTLINNLTGWLVCAIACTVYLLTMEPTASFWDCGEFIASANKLEVGHPPGAPFFMIVANVFSHLTSDPTQAARMVNTMSALASGFTILFLFFTVTHLVRKVIAGSQSSLSAAQVTGIMGSGIVGALTYTFTDTFWFSAVEGEVYALSSLFTAVVFWLILKWEENADKPTADKWIILIAYLMGLSIGVHLLNLLCIPAMVLVYYFKKTPAPSLKGIGLSLLASFAIVGVMMYGIVQGLVKVCGYTELFAVNVLRMPYDSGVFIHLILLAGVLLWAIYETMRPTTHMLRIKILFILAVILLGIPFIGNGFIIPIVLILALAGALFKSKNLPIKTLNTTLCALLVIVIGYSSYATIMIRAAADTPMNQNDPSDIFTLRSYLAREQYGSTPLIYGKTFASEVEMTGNPCQPVSKNATPVRKRIQKTSNDQRDEYIIAYESSEYAYVDALNVFFPRMYNSMSAHFIDGYKQWSNFKGTPVKISVCGEEKVVMQPTFTENLRYFFSYQVNFMYWRYFMWNFSGRQNDIQGHGGVAHGNWITGIKPIDAFLTGPQDDLPDFIKDNKGHNVYYMLPLLLGILGILFLLYSSKRGEQTLWITSLLFFMTGLAIVLYLNQTPFQVRERDYAYAGSFYAFCIWIGFGVVAIAKGLEKTGKVKAMVAASISSVACLLVPLQMAAQNWDDHDRSNRTIARDMGYNYLSSCDKDAILFTYGDNDTFPLWYAQEVEGYRTDVRVCNLSYLQMDCYIHQMQKQAYESAPLPISFTPAQYTDPKLAGVYLLDLVKDPLNVEDALKFVTSEDKRTKTIPGTTTELEFIPSSVLTYPVQKESVIANGVVAAQDSASILDTIRFDFSGRNALTKSSIMTLDILQTNNWKRPLYFAVTVPQSEQTGLSDYLQKEGMTSRVVPLDTSKHDSDINAEKSYHTIMNQFKWGGLDKPDVYLDETTLGLCQGLRGIVAQTAAQLIAEDKDEQALNLLDYSGKMMLYDNVPLDFSGIDIAKCYFELGQNEKAEEVLDRIVQSASSGLQWFFRLKPSQFASVYRDVQRSFVLMQYALATAQENESKLEEKYASEFNNYYMRMQALQKR